MAANKRSPLAIAIGGPNGAGKTTIAQRLLPEQLHVAQFVNADTIARGLCGFAPETVAMQAGRLMLLRLRQLAAQGESFAFETTMASRTFAPFLRNARAHGYLVKAVFVWLPSVELALRRVEYRVQTGGHGVPADVVTRRYGRGLANFWRLYRPLADQWFVYDNSGDHPAILAEGACERIERVHDKESWDAFITSVTCL